MKSINELHRNVMKRLGVSVILMLAICANLTAQPATQLPMEKKDSDEGVEMWFRQAQPPLSIEEVMEIAEEEIERTAQEAVKAALVEVGGELAYEKERADQLEKQKLALELENKKLKEEAQKKQKQFFYGALIGGAGGVVVTSLVFGIVSGLCK